MGATSWYVVREKITLSAGVLIYGNVQRILLDGCKLTAAGQEGEDEEEKVAAGIFVSGTDKIARNLYLYSGRTVTIGSPLSQGASIGVTTAATPGTVDVTGKNIVDYSSCFTSDNTSHSIVNSGTGDSQVVQLVDHVHQHSWSYKLSSDKKTISAECKGEGTCTHTGTDMSLTITAPANPT